VSLPACLPACLLAAACSECFAELTAPVCSQYLHAEVLGMDLVNIQPEKYAAAPLQFPA
jgi:hypothetical protein